MRVFAQHTRPVATTAARRRPTALVTGASSGIGEALAHCFAQGGHDVVLVNCAGSLHVGPFVDAPVDAHRALIELNVAALTAMLAQAVPPMVRRGRGRVINVASIASFQPPPTLATYAATTAYVLSLIESLIESLAEELQDSGVTDTALCPGITSTPMLAEAQRSNPSLRRLPSIVVGDIAAVAAEGYDACMRGEVIRVPGLLNRATVTAGRALPKWLLRRLGGVVSRRLG